MSSQSFALQAKNIANQDPSVCLDAIEASQGLGLTQAKQEIGTGVQLNPVIAKQNITTPKESNSPNYHSPGQ